MDFERYSRQMLVHGAPARHGAEHPRCDISKKNTLDRSILLAADRMTQPLLSTYTKKERARTRQHVCAANFRTQRARRVFKRPNLGVGRAAADALKESP